MKRNGTPQTTDARPAGRLWVQFYVILGCNGISTVVAGVTTGTILQVAGLVVFVTSMPLLWVCTRLLDHYEGYVTAVTSSGQRLRYGGFLLLVLWWLGAWVFGYGMAEQTLKLLVFLCLILNFSIIAGVLLRRDQYGAERATKDD